MYYPFRDYYMTRNTEFSGSAFYMWWDFSGCQNPTLITAAIGVLQQILSLPNRSCRDAALHGLNHLGPDTRVAAIIEGYLDENRQSLSAEEIDWALQVDGHTDIRPIASSTFPSNWELSTARAISVVRYLVSRGVSPQRLVAAGYGEFRPLEQGIDEASLRRNRRIELKLTNR